MEERIQANEEEINRYNRMLVSLYEDYKAGVWWWDGQIFYFVSTH